MTSNTRQALTSAAPVAIVGGPNVDAFGRLRVAGAIHGAFDSKLIYDLNPLWWEDTLGGGSVTLVANQAAARLSTGSGTINAYAYRQSRSYVPYQPGRSQFIAVTGTVGAAKAGVRKRWGLFDAQNGLFFEQGSDGVLYVVRRTYTTGQVVEEKVAQADWNINRLDGRDRGLSTVGGENAYQSLDITKANIFVIDYQWLGVGRVRFGVDIDGELVYLHEFDNANRYTAVYMSTPDLPVRYEVFNVTAVTGATTMDMICATVATEGGQDIVGVPQSIARTSTVAVSTPRAVLSIRPALTFAGKVNRTNVVLKGLDVAGNAAGACLWQLVYNPTLTTSGGALTWTAVDGTYSSMEYSVHGDANAGAFTGGTVLESGYVIGTANIRAAISRAITARVPLVLNAAGASPIVLSIVCDRVDTAGSMDVLANLNWEEQR